MQENDSAGAGDLDIRLEMAMDALGVPGVNAVEVCPGASVAGRACRLLLSNPNSLLDEPTNHLDADSVGCSNSLQKYRPVTRDARPLLPRQRSRLELELDQAGASMGRKLLVVSGNRSASVRPTKKNPKASGSRRQRDLAWIRMSPKDVTRTKAASFYKRCLAGIEKAERLKTSHPVASG